MVPMNIIIESNGHSGTGQQPSIDPKKRLNTGSKASSVRMISSFTADRSRTSKFFRNLKRCFWSIRTTVILVLISSIYIGIATTIGILIVSFTSPKPSAERCKMQFTPTTPNTIESNYGPRSVAIGYLDNDTELDMVVANSIVDKITIFFGYGNGSFPSTTQYSTGLNSFPYMVAVGDVNKDTYSDIVIANFHANSIAIFLGYGNGTFSNHTPISTNSSHPVWISIIDLNHDASLDIITANYGTHSISIFYGYGNGTFYHAATYSTGYDSLPLAVIAGDFNNDNQLDLMTANSGTNDITLFLSDGNGTFENHRALSTGIGSCPYAVVGGYFNDDTMLDIAVANYGTKNIGVFLGYGNGAFTNQTTYSTGIASPKDRWQ